MGLRANHHQKTKKCTKITCSSPSSPGFGNKCRSPLVEDSSALVWCPLPPEWEPAQTRLLHPILQATLASKLCTEIQLSSFACLLFLPLAASINHELQLRPLDCCRNNKVSKQTCVARHSKRNLPESVPLDSTSRSSSVSVEKAVPIIVGVGLALFLLLCGTKLVPLWSPCVPKTLPSDTLPPSRWKKQEFLAPTDGRKPGHLVRSMCHLHHPPHRGTVLWNLGSGLPCIRTLRKPLRHH